MSAIDNQGPAAEARRSRREAEPPTKSVELTEAEALRIRICIERVPAVARNTVERSLLRKLMVW
jgi:hypothetical protein